MRLVLTVHMRIKITARAPWVSLAIRAGVILIDKRRSDSKCPRFSVKGATAVVCSTPPNVQRIIQELKEIGLPGLFSVSVWVPANNTIVIRIRTSRGIWSGMFDILPVTGRLVVLIIYRLG